MLYYYSKFILLTKTESEMAKAQSSAFVLFSEALKEFQGLFEKTNSPEEAEKHLNLFEIQKVGDFSTALVAALITPTGDDLAVMSTATKSLISLQKARMSTRIEGPYKKANKKVGAYLTEVEVSLQNFFALKASQLPGGKTKNSALIKLIKDNTPGTK